MKKNLTIMCTLIAVAFTFISCASNNVVSSEAGFADEKAVIEAGAFQEIKTGKTVKGELTQKSIHIEDASNGSVPVAVYKLTLEANKRYILTLKSIPNGLITFDMDKKTAMIPASMLYDEEMNIVNHEKRSGRAVAPTATEPMTFQVTQIWTPEKSGTYYLVVKADMSSDQGLTLTMYNYQTSTDVYFRRVPYAKYSVEVK